MPTERHPAIRPEAFTYAVGHSTGAHLHHDHQLVYARDGVLSVETTEAYWTLPAQRAAWIPAGVDHTVVAASQATMATLYIEPIVQDGTALRSRVAILEVSPLLRQLILHLVDHADDEGAERRRIERVTIDQLLSAPAAPLGVTRLHDPRLQLIAAALDADPRDGRTLREFGAAVGASERTLQRLFVAETGAGFGRWRTQLRLQHGVVSLGRGESVTTAAARAGYDQPSAFIAAFKAAFGTTPGRFVER